MEQLQQWMTEIRRDLHRYAEPGWFEFRTTSVVAEQLAVLGYEVRVGREIVDEGAVMGRDAGAVPGQIDRALEQGADRKWIDRMDGYTGAVGVLDTGRPGPVIALRFDIDAVEVQEVTDEAHRPSREGFASVNPGAMHSCGHDGHTAMGLGLARMLMENREELNGVVKLIFQPAEEGVRGAKAIVEKGVLDDAEYFLGLHLGMGIPTGKVIGGASGFLCTTKFDVAFHGRSAHAGAAPNEGRNALLAAASATLNLHAIAPHGDGVSRVNVGVLKGGEGRNVIPPTAFMSAETRGETEEIASYVFDRASAVVAGAAAMYEAEHSVEIRGRSTTTSSDGELVDLVAETASELEGIREVERYAGLGGSDDAAWMMQRVQARGGQAVYVMLGSDIAAGHHNEYFDFDEAGLSLGVALLSSVIAGIPAQRRP